jgi:hypothetical protein
LAWWAASSSLLHRRDRTLLTLRELLRELAEKAAEDEALLSGARVVLV